MSRQVSLTPNRTTRELAEALNVGHSTVKAWCREGRVATIRAGKLYRIPANEFERVLREGVGPKQESGHAS